MIRDSCRRFLGTLRLCLPALAAALAVSSCGLEEYVYLYPPSTSLSGDIFKFTNNTQNDPTIFFGFKILYRFYGSESAVSTATSRISSLYASFPTTFYDKMKAQTPEYGFRDLLIGDTESRELIIDMGSRNDAFSVEIDFLSSVSIGSDATIVISEGSPGTSPDISSTKVVYQQIDGYSLTGFSTTDLVDRAEVFEASENYDDATNQTYLVLYVFAYGYNSSFGTVYSEPKSFIGTTSFVVLNTST